MQAMYCPVMALLAAVLLGEPPSYSRDVAPILTRKCFVCHGPDASTRKARLRLDTPDGATQPRGRRAPAITPGSLDDSLLWQRITADDPYDRMPPADEGHLPLTQEERDVLSAWILAGAPYEAHWSWEPIASPDVPTISDADWPRSDIDAFIMTRLEREGLSPAPDASPTSLLRRLHFDLTGLPPEPAIAQAFAADPSAQAYEAHVDRLLSDPGFGEQWGRHWLDLVRYAESHGHEYDYDIQEAWRYRDWVIAAMNADMSWDQFVREQLAGDLLSQKRSEQMRDVPPPVVATGWWWLSQGTHAPVDVRQDELDRIDNQIDVFSRAFLGTTMACSRCHDHKFDAISQEDYYAMVGIIRSSRRRYVHLDLDGEMGRSVSILNELHRDAQEEISKQIEPAAERRAAITAENASYVWDFGERPTAYHGWSTTGWAFPKTVDIPGAISTAVGETPSSEGQAHSALVSKQLQGAAQSPGFTIDRDRIFVRARGERAKIRIYIDHYWLDEFNPLLFEDMILAVEDPDQWTTLSLDVSRYQGQDAYLELIDDGDGFISVDWIVHADALPDALTLPAPVDRVAKDLSGVPLDQLRQIEQTLPPPARALAMQEGDARDAPVLLRGNHRSNGPMADRTRAARFLLPGTTPLQGSGRMALADGVLDPMHPLTARVVTNRVWHHLFGRGLTATPDDMGAMGMPPTHPELLDYLATGLQADWDYKALIKRIVMSRAYAMASTHPDPLAYERDPDCRLRSRAAVRRLTAENLRDAMLQVAGALDRRRHGPPVPVHLRESMQGRGRPSKSGPLDGDNRRSVYLAVRRNFLDPFMTSFDQPTPATTQGKRSVSNVPEQGLILFNDPLVQELSRRWAMQLQAAGWSPQEVAASIIASAYGRVAEEEELTMLTAALQEHPDDWTPITQAVLASKEFQYLD
jgi:hypothetical protein